MKLSARGRYALASCIILSDHFERNELLSLQNISKELDISKIYLEQVFSLLKRGSVVESVKGANGGYKLARHMKDITMYDVLEPIETGIFEKTKATFDGVHMNIEKAMSRVVYDPLDEVVEDKLKSITLEVLFQKSREDNDQYMFYI